MDATGIPFTDSAEIARQMADERPTPLKLLDVPGCPPIEIHKQASAECWHLMQGGEWLDSIRGVDGGYRMAKTVAEWHAAVMSRGVA